MANIDLRPGSSAVPACTPEIVRVGLEVDFAANPAAQNDIVQLLNLAAGTRVLAVDMELITAEGGTLTADVGIFSTAMAAVDVDGFLDGMDLNATPGWFTDVPVLTEADPNTFNPAYQLGHLCTADRILGLTALNAADLAKVVVWVTLVAPAPLNLLPDNAFT